MTAALLRNELFHHLLASNPEKTGRDNVRAGALALAFHVALILLLLQIPTATRPAIEHTITTPILLENISLPGHTNVVPQGGGGGGIAVGPPNLPPADFHEFSVPSPQTYNIGKDLRPIMIAPPAPGQGGVGGRGQGEEGINNFSVVQSAPRMLNASEVSTQLQREYPQQLMQAGIGGTVVLHVLINPAGQVIDARVAESSGVRALDEAALRVSRHMQFVPAQNRDQAVRVWAEIPVVFSARD